ncbi:JAB domain-containing protein [Flagellimonas nanhaiensis]|uniref:DNA repair protein n=1 Tax=Flagellimonas nanhaiensis TaxID=2292706 RepID=A0A371JLL1_9FLAO|nr:JAB domain-containing protein [Allomuricauda nanhaiensis]RDY57846.1 DNA repair protein [Allomuricauda nanhaiensis]
MKTKVNEIQISYKEKIKISDAPKICSSKDAAKLLFEFWDKGTIELQESFKILLLNNSNKVKGIYEISKGGISATYVDVRILFATVLKSLSVGIIMSHNHPSGQLKPSKADLELTSKVKAASNFFDIKVLDHLIISSNGEYLSFADEGLL